MAKPSHRDKILQEGLRVVHERGFGGASVRDIVHAAGVPQGSFTNHFGSKEAFGLEIIEIYFANTSEIVRRTLSDESLSPLQRLSAYIETTKTRMIERGVRNGCLFGNFAAEASEHSEAIRTRIVEIFTSGQKTIASCLRAAVEAGEIPVSIDCDEVAGFVMSSMQGAILFSKTQRDPLAMTRFKQVLFRHVLSRPDLLDETHPAQA